MKFEEKITNIETVHEGNITTYQLADVTLPDGREAKREIVRHDDAAAVIAFTDDQKMILVRQYRVTIGKTTLELPAGLRDEGDRDGIVTAQREFEEETGLSAKEWRFVTSFYSTPGYTDEFLEIYEAHGIEKVEDAREQDDDEFIEVVALDFDEAMDAYSRGELCDSKTVFALFYWQMKRHKASQEEND
ncbi:MAG TPA: NUDIX hydrolase [Atopostipes sp.]|jgi:ADP-ribose pyrophosphatase|nr:NUDIX hydrolase [Atopostipes sp.]